MAVRFLPPPEDRAAAASADRGDLAEVIEFRSRLGARSHHESNAPASTGAAGESDAETATAPAEATGSNVIDAVFGGRAARPGTAADLGSAADLGAGAGADRGAGAPSNSPGQLRRSARKNGSDAAGAIGSFADDSETDEQPARTANEDAVRLLARRARSSGELRAELVALGHDSNEVEDVIDEFVRSLYLDDLGLARIVTEKLREGKRASRAQIRQKLRERKFDDEAIETALGELDDDEEFALLRRTAVERARRLGGVDRQTAERRLLGFLARRGWSGEPAVRAVRDALDGTGARTGGSRPSSSGRGSGVRFE